MAHSGMLADRAQINPGRIRFDEPAAQHLRQRRRLVSVEVLGAGVPGDRATGYGDEEFRLVPACIQCFSSR